MVATVVINRLTGAGPAETAITSACTRAGASDEPTNGSPVRIPTSSCNYSYWVNTQLDATAAPDNQIDNIQWYTDGTLSFGTGIFAIVTTACTYTQADGVAGSSGSLLDLTNYPNIASGGTSPAASRTSSCKLAVAGSIAAATGAFGDRVVFQLSVDNTASPGNSAEETFTFEFDES